MKREKTPAEKFFWFCGVLLVLAVVGTFFRSGNEPHRPSEKVTLQETTTATEPDPRLLCMNAIRAQAKFPTKVDFHFRYLQMAPMKDDPDAIGIRGRADMMNGFGSMIPHVFGCEVKNGIVIQAAATPG